MTNLKAIDKNIKTVVTTAAKLNGLIHTTAVMVAEHAQEHGDCTRALALVKAMPASMRKTMLVLWFHTFTPIRVREANDKVGMLKATDKGFTPFNIEEGKATPFHLLAEQNPEKSYSFDELVKLVARLGASIDKKITEGKVPGEDVESARAISKAITGLKFARVGDIKKDDIPVATNDEQPQPVTLAAAA